MGSAPSHRLGVAGGILNMTRSLGTSLGVAASGAILSLRLAAHTGHHVASTLDVGPTALLPAFRETMLFLAVLAFLAAAISAVRGTQTVASPAPDTGGEAGRTAAEAALEAASS